LVSAIRDTDTLGRIGGEEFCVVLPDTPAEGAKVVAERIRSSIDQREIDIAKAGLVRITVSIGVAVDNTRTLEGERARRGSRPPTGIPDEATDAALDEMTQVADAALYRAKQQGRNRVEVAVLSPGSGSPNGTVA
jgi:PleD family two-component response regulator